MSTDARFNLRAVVPVYCQLQQRGPGILEGENGSFSLGTFREYCNAPSGYTLTIHYAPGTLEGTVITAGPDRVVLDGSGRTVLSRSQGPRFRNRDFFATPGERGFDTDRITFDLIPTSIG